MIMREYDITTQLPYNGPNEWTHKPSSSVDCGPNPWYAIRSHSFKYI